MIERFNPKETEPSILKFWQEKDIYKKAKEKNKGKEKFYFLDGPPYTSGRMHIGLAWNKALKDAVLRYKRMQGYDVWDRAGYDMHGLPTENATQKKFKLKGKKEIAAFGIDKFIERCKDLSEDHMIMMNRDFERLGVWMDFDNAYQSIKKEFIEGEWMLIKKAHEKKRLYRGLRTMTWCPITESALAKHELEYKSITDKSIFVKFKLKGRENEYLIIWTTTPWTIAFNLAVMVNPEIDYVKAKVGNEIWYVAGVLANVFISSVANKKHKVIETLKGEQLEGAEYEHPFYPELNRYYDEIKSKAPKTHTVVLSKEYVDTSSGSGLVHCAPGCGPEDYEVGHRNGIPPFNNIDARGVFPKDMGKFSGLTARKDDDKIIDALEEANALIATTDVEHEYPHDWRYHKPVIFRTTKQWFFKVEDLKEKMIESNKKVTWVPNSAFNAFDSWLKNLRDNSISKQRYWGTPLPIWVNVSDENDYIVVGSAKELEQLSGKKADDLHISTVDSIVINKDGKSYKRVPDVLDVWVDAGTVSWNCLGYPAEQELFKELFPADFILEGKDQIRGWFNLLVVASMLAFGKPSFKSVYMHGFVQDSQGRKMSKSLGNIISPYEVIDTYGADVLRYYMIGGANPGLDINYNLEDTKLKSRNLMVLWNVHKYLIDMCTNGKIDPTKPGKNSMEEDYILSRLHSTIKSVTEMFDDYRLNEIPIAIEKLFLDLSRVYIQITRDKDPRIVAPVVYTVLVDVLKIFAPIAPFTSELIYQNLKEAFNLKEESIHLFKWPKHEEKKIKRTLEEEMNICQDTMQSILAGREKLQLGVRWPLKEVVIVTEDTKTKAALKKISEIIKKQTNIKELKIQSSMRDVKTIIKANSGKLGQDFGNNVPKIIAKLTSESNEKIVSHLKKENKFTIKVNNKSFELVKEHIIIERKVPNHLQEVSFSAGLIYLNKERTDELEAEGFAREITRRIQSLRKKAGLTKQNKINLFIKVDSELKELLSDWTKQIKEKVGAKNIEISELKPSKKHKEHSKEKIKSKSVEVWFDVTV